MKYPYPLVEVLWIDAYTDHGWEDEVEIREEEVVTVGFLISQNDKGLCIASSTGEDGSHNARIVIPGGMVKKVRTLKNGRTSRTAGSSAKTGEQDYNSGNKDREYRSQGIFVGIQDRPRQRIGPMQPETPAPSKGCP